MTANLLPLQTFQNGSTINNRCAIDVSIGTAKCCRNSSTFAGHYSAGTVVFKRDVNIAELTEQMADQNPLPGFLNVTQIMEFIHRRHLDRTAAGVLGYSVLVLSLMLLLLPLRKLINVYLHALSVLLFGLAHFISTQYIDQEIKSGLEFVVLDDFVKLERHGYTFIAQMMLSVAICFLIGVESGPARIMLAVFTVPICSRMCGLPLDKLTIAHNISSAFAMFFMCSYVLYNVPDLIHSFHQGFKQMRTVLMIRGFSFGFVVLCRRLRLTVLFTTFWILMFLLRYYAEFSLSSTGTTILSAISPFSLLALGITIGYASQFIVRTVQMILGGAERESNTNTTGFFESLTLVIICVHAGVLGMNVNQKMLMLKLVLFVVLSALLQSLCDVLSGHMLVLAANPMTKFNQHLRCISMSVILFFAPFVVVYTLVLMLPMNLWLVLILSNCSMISLRVLQASVIYGVSITEQRSEEQWDGFDNLTYWCNFIKMSAELLLSSLVVFYGVYNSLVYGIWNVFSVIVLLGHSYYNVFRRSEEASLSIQARREALLKIKSLNRVDSGILKDIGEQCVICCSEMTSGVLRTPCGHLFHNTCVKKWICVKAVCPLCNKNLEPESETTASTSRRNSQTT
ncbi:RING-type domain-containing protein [Aphelenchoides bicaudatus]|nr:RING-type domain-containing protein [Aphelenchoides bicaudatus]